jgi:hypothetical protein
MTCIDQAGNASQPQVGDGGREEEEGIKGGDQVGEASHAPSGVWLEMTQRPSQGHMQSRRSCHTILLYTRQRAHAKPKRAWMHMSTNTPRAHAQVSSSTSAAPPAHAQHQRSSISTRTGEDQRALTGIDGLGIHLGLLVQYRHVIQRVGDR